MVVAIATGAAGYCVGRYQSVSTVKEAYATGDGFAAPVQEESLSSTKARMLYGKGQYFEALVETAKVLERNPSDAGAYSVMKLSMAKLGTDTIPGRTPPATVAPPGIHSRADEADKRVAMKHWNAGIIYFQKGDYAKTRDEWLLCKQLDPRNADCQTGLERIDRTYGNGS